METQSTINQWCEDTFGPVGSNYSVAERADEEMIELLDALHQNDNDSTAGEECADIVIILYRLCERLGVNLLDEVDRKMKINRQRKWKLRGDGHGDHVK